MKWTVSFFDNDDNTLSSVDIECAFAHNAAKVASRVLETSHGKEAFAEVVKKTDWIRVSKIGGS